jgi:predicted Zn-ribbon and HTH transcriptional regulator
VLKVEKTNEGNLLTVSLTGSIEETTDLAKVIGDVPGELNVLCKGIGRINSVGVKGWIKYFQGLRSQGKKLRFQQCSTAIVEQINLISNFTERDEVESILVPFLCDDCGTELVGAFRTTDLKKIGFQIPDLKCSKCGSKASFDDIAEEYFHFLQDV